MSQLDLFAPEEDAQLPLIFPRSLTAADYNAIPLLDGRILYKFQGENVAFSAEGNFRTLIADDTGLGKATSVAAIIHHHRDKLLPVLIVCKTTLKVQQQVELLAMTGIASQIIRSSKDPILDNVQSWITSYDLLKRLVISDFESAKLLVLDECQSIKNWESNRTNALVQLAKTIPYIIATSATPIKNAAYEYFPILHILRPTRFPRRSEFEMMCDVVQTGSGTWKRAGINPYYEKTFKALTSDTIIRHQREDVAPDLPKARRSHRFVKIEEKKDVSAINKATERFVEAYDRASDWDGETDLFKTREEAQQAARSSLMALRHVVGRAKIPFIVDFIEEFLTENEDRKLTVFIHHRDVADGVIAGVGSLIALNKIDTALPYQLRGGMNERERDSLVTACTRNSGWPSEDGRCRLMVASTLAAGEGINLQKCYDSLLGERQFNPANEDQASPGRFLRLNMERSVGGVFTTVLTAIDTLDAWFEELVSFKRSTISATLGDKSFGNDPIDEHALFSDLMEKVATEGRKSLLTFKRRGE